MINTPNKESIADKTKKETFPRNLGVKVGMIVFNTAWIPINIDTAIDFASDGRYVLAGIAGGVAIGQGVLDYVIGKDIVKNYKRK